MNIGEISILTMLIPAVNSVAGSTNLIVRLWTEPSSKLIPSPNSGMLTTTLPWISSSIGKIIVCDAGTTTQPPSTATSTSKDSSKLPEFVTVKLIV